MTNRTDPGAKRIKGLNPQYLVSTIVRQKVWDDAYWKEHCFALNSVTIVDMAVKLPYLAGTYGGRRAPSKFLCLLLKMLQIEMDIDVAKEYLLQDDNKYLRALGATYIRMTAGNVENYTLLEPYLTDMRKLRVRKIDGTFEIKHMDEFIDMLLHDNYLFDDIAFPKLMSRQLLEETQDFPPYISPIADDFNFDDVELEPPPPLPSLPTELPEPSKIETAVEPERKSPKKSPRRRSRNDRKSRSRRRDKDRAQRDKERRDREKDRSRRREKKRNRSEKRPPRDSSERKTVKEEEARIESPRLPGIDSQTTENGDDRPEEAVDLSKTRPDKEGDAEGEAKESKKKDYDRDYRAKARVDKKRREVKVEGKQEKDEDTKRREDANRWMEKKEAEREERKKKEEREERKKEEEREERKKEERKKKEREEKKRKDAESHEPRKETRKREAAEAFSQKEGGDEKKKKKEKKSFFKEKKTAPVSQPDVDAGAGDLSIEQTNSLRLKLGLKPLKK